MRSVPGWREVLPPARRPRPALWWIAPAFAAILWPALSLCILVHRVFASNDSVSNYAHVWYLATSLWERGVVPLHMPSLNHGQGLTCPYGGPPWLVGALLWPLLGEWSVTLLLVLGAAAVTLAAIRWQPALRQPFLLALLLLNPFLIEALVLAQLPFLWAAACFFMAAAALRRGRPAWAAPWLALALITHPAIMLPPGAVLLACSLRCPGRRRGVLIAGGLALLAFAPAAALTLATPALSENSHGALLLNYAATLAPRAVVLAMPLLLVRYRQALHRVAGPVAVFAVALPLAVLPLRRDTWAFKQLLRTPSATAVPAIRDASFAPGAVYRVLDAADGKISMYRAMRAGAVLDSDFFPESLNRRSWPSAEPYLAFLTSRTVEYVLITHDFDRDFHTNEHALLHSLTTDGRAALVFSNSTLDVFRLTRAP